jgi:multidrug resistance protein, MATE family
MQAQFSALLELAQFSFPLILIRLSATVRMLILTWLFAQLGASAMAAGALIISLFITLSTFCIGVLMTASGVMCAYAIGAEDDAEVVRVLQQSVWLAVLISIPLMLLLYQMQPLLVLLQQPTVIVMQVAAFAKGLAWMFLPFCLGITIYKLFVNVKQAKVFFIYTVFTLAMNAGLGYVLMQSMGIAGVSFALALTSWLQLVAVMLHAVLNQHTCRYVLGISLCWPQWDYIGKLWALGWPVGCKLNLQYFLLFIFANVLGAYAWQELPVYQLLLQVFLLTACLASGVAMSMEVLVAQALGAGDTADALATVRTGLILVVIYVGVTIIIGFGTQGYWLPYIFANDSVNYQLVWQCVPYVIIYQLLSMVRSVLSSCLVVFKRSKEALLAEVLGPWLLGFPLGLVLCIYLHQHLLGVLQGLAVGAVGSALMMTRYYSVAVKNLLLLPTSR